MNLKYKVTIAAKTGQSWLVTSVLRSSASQLLKTKTRRRRLLPVARRDAQGRASRGVHHIWLLPTAQQILTVGGGGLANNASDSASQTIQKPGFFL